MGMEAISSYSNTCKISARKKRTIMILLLSQNEMLASYSNTCKISTRKREQ